MYTFYMIAVLAEFAGAIFYIGVCVLNRDTVAPAEEDWLKICQPIFQGLILHGIWNLDDVSFRGACENHSVSSDFTIVAWDAISLSSVVLRA